MRANVWVIIPAWNEAETIGGVVREVYALPPDPAFRLSVLVVDGGSSDTTVPVAESAGAQTIRQVGRGYGAACFTGLNTAADADILVYLDGDGSDPPDLIAALIAPLLRDEADLVLGVRSHRNSEAGALPIHARAGNLLVVGLIRLFSGVTLRDLPSFKAVRRVRLESLGMREMTYGWTTEMLTKAARARWRIAEVEVSYRRRSGGKSKVSGTLRGSAKAAYALVRTALTYRAWRPD